jgi:glucosamine--fructose-6-phosphate aminotransferase (isomerizing)
MCGIFGIVLNNNNNNNNNNENIYNLIINGLIQLQNRGYDSAGICVIKNNKFEVNKCASTNKLNAIDKLMSMTDIKESKDNTYIGIGHNRWATHGVKNDTNAHPHLSCDTKFVIVHNGIIENYNEIKQKLIKEGFIFNSQTDTEVIVNLLQYNYDSMEEGTNMTDIIKQTIEELRGTYGLLIQSLYEPNKLYCVRNGSPLLIGQNDEEVIVTSEQSGFCNKMSNYITLHNDDICVITKTNENISINTSHNYIKKNVTLVDSTQTPHPYKHWTLKEINDQPDVILNSINKGGRIKNASEVKLGGLEQHIDSLKNINNVIILGCGTSYFAGLYGMYFFKQLCQFNTVQVFDGAEFNEQDIPTIGNTVFILISQSGETKDLHRCIEISKNNNITTIGIVNVVDSLIAREVDCGIYCNAGKEVGVASTKAFTSQVVCLSMAAIWFSTLQNINEKKRVRMVSDLHNLSSDIKLTLDICSENVKEYITKINKSNMFLLGKGSDEFIAKEGALKIKEISYIHSEGYSSSSLKHGPFALLDENFPVIILNMDQTHRAKTLNCYQEVSSRNAPVLLITNDISISTDVLCDIIYVPENKSYASLLGIIPIQLLAYYLSVNKGINPDKPKNLAKVVTVE